MPAISQAVTFLYTHDLDATAAFYEGVLGLPLALDQGACRIYQVAPEAFLGFCQRAAGPAPDGVIFTFVTDQVDAWWAHLQAHGATIEKPPSLHPEFQIYHLFARDPNGYLLEFQRFLDPAWPQPAGKGAAPGP